MVNGELKPLTFSQNINYFNSENFLFSYHGTKAFDGTVRSIALATTRQRALQEGAIETKSIVSAIYCSSIIAKTGIDTNGLQCVEVLTTFIASVSIGFNVAAAVASIEQLVQTVEFARMLSRGVQGSGIVFTVILPPSRRPSSFPSSSPSTSIADPSSVPTLKPSTTKSQKNKKGNKNIKKQSKKKTKK